MNAVILAGGFGSRLKPMTDSVPKPMLPVANTPMLDYAVSHLIDAGIRDTVFTLGYYPEQVAQWVDGYSAIKARYVVEDVPLGTAGGVRKAAAYLDKQFIVVSGDALENIDYAAMLRSHIRSNKLVTMAVTNVPDPRSFGLVEYDEDGTVTRFIEKPEDVTQAGTVNCGVYIIERAAMKYVPLGKKYDFARDLFPVLVQKGQVNAYFHDGYWSDVGLPTSYYEANFAMRNGGFYTYAHNKYRTVSHRFGGERVSVAAYSSLIAGHCAESIVGAGAAVASGARVERCVVLPNVTVRGHHYGEIVGNGFSLPMQTDFALQVHDSTQIYKNFS